jgi:HlyD family secretion protein
MKLNKNIKIAIALVVLGVVAFIFINKGEEPLQVTYEYACVEKATLSSSITATGTIEPVTTVEVGTQVSGIINEIFVDYNDAVRKGQVIAVLDKENLESELSSAKNNLQSAEADLKYQQWQFNKQKALHEQGDISDNAFQQAELALSQAQSAYNMRREAVRKAETNLGYATITSPIDGVILSKAVEEGQTVAASFNTPTLFTIVKDLTDMRVIAKVDEADIGGVKEGQRVAFNVDAYPTETFAGAITQVRQEATIENNVVTYEVVIAAPNAELKLKPGLTANVTIYTMELADVLSVPTKALRFDPNFETLSEGDVIEDCAGENKLWKRQGQTFKAIPVQIGVNNGARTEIVGGINEGDSIILSMDVVVPGADQQMAQRSPFMPGPRKNNKAKK